MGKIDEMAEGTVVVDAETAAKVVRRHPASADPRSVRHPHRLSSRRGEGFAARVEIPIERGLASVLWIEAG
ncbi:MAG: hypothetical protein JWM74_1848, partial [Myxococcaceae bacterium]|nr:hypothetical protein [Myxococcaceae bacterium]